MYSEPLECLTILNAEYIKIYSTVVMTLTTNDDDRVDDDDDDDDDDLDHRVHTPDHLCLHTEEIHCSTLSKRFDLSNFDESLSSSYVRYCVTGGSPRRSSIRLLVLLPSRLQANVLIRPSLLLAWIDPLQSIIPCLEALVPVPIVR